MKLYDIYISKNKTNLIQIDSFATHMGYIGESNIVIFRQLENHQDIEFGSCPSFNGYGTREEIEKEYELFISCDELYKYKTWKDIFDKAQLKETELMSQKEFEEIYNNVYGLK